MGRGVPWDELWNEKMGKVSPVDVPPVESELPAEPRNMEKDLTNIGRHFLQGFAVGAVSGAVFGLGDVLMDPKAMKSGKTNPAPAKVLRFGSALGIFLSTYYGMKKTLYLYNSFTPTSVDKDGANDVAAAVLAFVPIVAHTPFRRFWPYATVLLCFDYVSGK